MIKMEKLRTSPIQQPDENLTVLIKRGPVSVETSLKELEENYASKPEWKVIENEGVLRVPVEEFRMIDLPKPDHTGKVDFGRKKGRKGDKIEEYPPAQTIKI